MLKAYISALLELADKDSRIIHLLADSGEGFDGLFAHSYPNRMFNFGIAEQNMLGAAAGLALTGKIPFVFAQGAFLSYRGMEFIRDDICLQRANVKIVGTGSGLSLSTLGPSHHTTEDISVLRALPNLTIYSPAGAKQVKNCLERAGTVEGPVYIRLAMRDNGDIPELPERMTDGGFDEIEVSGEESDILILSTGTILRETIKASRLLEAKGIRTKLVNVWKLKPFGREKFMDMLGVCQMCVTVEEHNIHGGLGSIVAEVMAGYGAGKRLVPIGLNDRFATGYGTYEDVRRQNELSAGLIAEKIMGEYKK